MLSGEEIARMNAEAQAKRQDLVAVWDAAFHYESCEISAEIFGGVMPQKDETVTDVWVELPRYGGIVIAVETSHGRILSPYYDQSPKEETEEFAENNPDGFLDMMYGATEYALWTEYPTTGIRYWG